MVLCQISIIIWYLDILSAFRITFILFLHSHFPLPVFHFLQRLVDSMDGVFYLPLRKQTIES